MGELIDKVKGKAKQIQGDLTDNPAKKAEGLVDEVKGQVKGKFEEIKQGIKEGVNHAKSNHRDDI